MESINQERKRTKSKRRKTKRSKSRKTLLHGKKSKSSKAQRNTIYYQENPKTVPESNPTSMIFLFNKKSNTYDLSDFEAEWTRNQLSIEDVQSVLKKLEKDLPTDLKKEKNRNSLPLNSTRKKLLFLMMFINLSVIVALHHSFLYSQFSIHFLSTMIFLIIMIILVINCSRNGSDVEGYQLIQKATTINKILFKINKEDDYSNKGFLFFWCHQEDKKSAHSWIQLIVLNPIMTEEEYEDLQDSLGDRSTKDQPSIYTSSFIGSSLSKEEDNDRPNKGLFISEILENTESSYEGKPPGISYSQSEVVCLEKSEIFTVGGDEPEGVEIKEESGEEGYEEEKVKGEGGEYIAVGNEEQSDQNC